MKGHGLLFEVVKVLQGTGEMFACIVKRKRTQVRMGIDRPRRSLQRWGPKVVGRAGYPQGPCPPPGLGPAVTREPEVPVHVSGVLRDGYRVESRLSHPGNDRHRKKVGSRTQPGRGELGLEAQL